MDDHGYYCQYGQDLGFFVCMGTIHVPSFHSPRLNSPTLHNFALHIKIQYHNNKDVTTRIVMH